VLVAPLQLAQSELSISSVLVVAGVFAGGVLAIAALCLWGQLRGARREANAVKQTAATLADVNCALLRQIDEHAATERALRSSRERIRTVVRDSPLAIVTLDGAGRIAELNHGAERMFGWSATETVGKPFSVLLVSGFAAVLDQALCEAAASADDVVGKPFVEAIGVRRDGIEFPVEMSVLRWQGEGEPPKFTALMADLSQRRRLHEEILRTTLDERRRVGRELHDDLGQILVAIAYRAGSLAALLADGTQMNDAREIARLAREATRRCQRLSRGLAAAEEDVEELCQSLERLAAWTRAFTRIQCTFAAAGEPLPVTLREAPHLRSIVQEAVTNAVKHSGARQIWIELEYRPPALSLVVRDDGSGTPDPPPLGEGLGLKLMAQRAALIGATLAIHGGQGERGTVVVLSWRRRRTAELPSVDGILAAGSELAVPRR